MEFRTVALIGAGAVGCFFIRGLSDVLGNDFCLVADGERADRLRNQGLVINGEQVFPNIRTPEEAAGADLILIATKYNGLAVIMEDLRKMTAPHTTVVSTLNGVDIYEAFQGVHDFTASALSYLVAPEEQDSVEAVSLPDDEQFEKLVSMLEEGGHA